MVNFNAWLNVPSPLVGTPTENKAARAAAAWKRIDDKPTSVVFTTAVDVALAAQTVRLESDDRATLSESAAGAAPVRKLIVFGVMDHPTVPNTDMAEGYTFYHDGDQYTIIDIVKTIGEIQGVAEASR